MDSCASLPTPARGRSPVAHWIINRSMPELGRELRAGHDRGLGPDVFLGDSAVAPFRYGHHPATVLEFPDHARPVA